MDNDESKTPRPDKVPAVPAQSLRTNKSRRKKSRRLASSAAKESANERKKGRPKGGAARPFPRETLERAMSIASTIRDKNGGKPWTPQDVANALGLSAGTSTFFYLAAAARDHGFTIGGRDSATISLTDLGRRAVYPASAGEDSAARLEAFRKVEVFAKVLGHYGGNRLPELQYVKNTLKRDFSIDEEHHEDFVKLFKADCTFVGLKDGQALSEVPAADRRTSSTTRKDDATGTITVAEPAGADSGLCFVIMPFSEKDLARPKNFFNEVLNRLITPACVDAGFRVVTADRRGSDVIHSTIVNSLLDADLVIVDLTDHNPNVLFELGMRMREDKPVALIQAEGTARIFDVDNVLRVYSYNSNLWTSTLETDKPALTEHVRAAWDNRASGETYMKLLRKKVTPE